MIFVGFRYNDCLKAKRFKKKNIECFTKIPGAVFSNSLRAISWVLREQVTFIHDVVKSSMPLFTKYVVQHIPMNCQGNTGKISNMNFYTLNKLLKPRPWEPFLPSHLLT